MPSPDAMAYTLNRIEKAVARQNDILRDIVVCLKLLTTTIETKELAIPNETEVEDD